MAVQAYETNLRPFSYLAPVLVAVVSCYVVYSFFRGGIYRYPGPFLANITNWWWTASVASKNHHLTLINLHRKYGDIVRIGPNALSIANVDYIPKIYGINSGFTKGCKIFSEMYDLFAPRVNGKPLPSFLSLRDEKEYAYRRRLIANFYSLSSLTEYEPLVDEIIVSLMDQLKTKFDRKKDQSCDLSLWLRYYAFDVIMQLSFSHNLGFVEQGKDTSGFMKMLDESLDIVAIAITMPWVGWLIQHSPIVGMLRKESTTFPEFSRKQIQEHIAKNKSRESSGAVAKNENPPLLDFLDRFLIAARADTPSGFNLDLVVSWTLANIMAGSDTTAIGLRAIVYFLLKSPDSLSKLQDELRRANLSYPVSWKESQQLPYLDACIKEAFRLHPAIGLGLERKVPSTGLVLPDGFNLSPGINVSVNAWVSGRHAIFGPDVDQYIPERWLQGMNEEPDVYKERIGRMKRADLVFGSGTRSCIGKNISLLEIYKAVPTLFRNFDVELVDPNKEWVTSNRWTVRQEGIECWLKNVS